jgi:hypothetical protein
VSVKKNFVLRMDEEMYKALEKWAADEFRSVNGQIEWILDKALKETGRIKDLQKPSKKNNK